MAGKTKRKAGEVATGTLTATSYRGTRKSLLKLRDEVVQGSVDY
jgi:hypothetical protein